MAFITSTSQPTSGALGDEWFNPNTNRIYKLVPLNGTNVTWREYNLPSLTPTPFIPIYGPGPVGIIQMLVVAGGGGGGAQGGGGGAGGLLYYGSANAIYKAPNGNSLSLGSNANITVVIGAGGAGRLVDLAASRNGGNTIVTILSLSSNVTYNAVGGGGGGAYNSPIQAGSNGGSGGGGIPIGEFAGGSGIPGQGNSGGSGAWRGNNPTGLGGGGGGGAGQVGKSPSVDAPVGGYQNYGGFGVQYNISGSNVWYAGGGGGGGYGGYGEGGGEGGRGGGGGGLYALNDGSGGGYPTGRFANATNVLAGTQFTWGPGGINTGGGGGGGAVDSGTPITNYPGLTYYAGTGGSGIVIIRANTSIATYSANVAVTTVAGESVYTFNGSGTLSLTGVQVPINLPVVTPVITASPVVYPTSPYYLPVTPAGPGLAPNVSSSRYLAIAGGGGSGGNAGSGGGAGGVLTGNTLAVVSGTPYAVTIGAGGAASPGGDPTSGTAGTSTTIIGGVVSISATGGGAGRGATSPMSAPVNSGGSGGGAPGESTTVGTGISSPERQGYPGVAGAGSGASRSAGGGGGAGGVGEPAPGPGYSPAGGIGINLDIEGSPKYYAGGGGGGSHQTPGPGAGGLGGGGTGGRGPGGTSTDGFVNYGGGGGAGAGYGGSGRSGGSGIVIFAHPVAFANATVTGSNTLVSSTLGNIIYRFYSPGTITF